MENRRRIYRDTETWAGLRARGCVVTLVCFAARTWYTIGKWTFRKCRFHCWGIKFRASRKLSTERSNTVFAVIWAQYCVLCWSESQGRTFWCMKLFLACIACILLPWTYQQHTFFFFCLTSFFLSVFFSLKNFYVHFPHWFTTMCPQHDSTGPNQLGKVNSRQFVGSHEVSVDLFTSNTHTHTFKTVFKSRRHVLLWPVHGCNIREVDGRRHVQSI